MYVNMYRRVTKAPRYVLYSQCLNGVHTRNKKTGMNPIMAVGFVNYLGPGYYCKKDFFVNYIFYSILSTQMLCRAQPDWAYEFPDRTGPDTKVCPIGPARLD